MKYFALLGDPVTHSLSPQIHHYFAKNLGIKLSYKLIQVQKTEIHRKLKELQSLGYSGVNITAPLKELTYPLMTACSTDANQAQSVNTILFKSNNHFYGDNTDGVGLIDDLKINLKFPLQDKKILILGAGGAARGILCSLLKQKPNQVFIANRTLEKAVILAAQCGLDNLTESLSLPEIVNVSADIDLILNTIPSSAAWKIPILKLQTHTLCYDLSYTSNKTAFLNWSQRCGSRTMVTGIGMLIEQARYGFKLFHGKLPQDSAGLLIKSLSKFLY